MPRGPRLDAPGTLHHVMVRGIDKQAIFIDDRDRNNFVSRLASLVKATESPVYAWALMPNHVHILLKSGPNGLPKLMRRLLTGYAVSYNKRHRRHGHLFENRYKSIVCEEDVYFKELVRYIHLNPLRAGLVESLSKLDRYNWIAINGAGIVSSLGSGKTTGRIPNMSSIGFLTARFWPEDPIGLLLSRVLGRGGVPNWSAAG